MRIALFCHSLSSDWNHGSAHFSRGVATELATRGHDVRVLEPATAWSVKALAAEHGTWPFAAMRRVYPLLSPECYDPARIDLERELDEVDLVLVHESTEHDMIARLGRMRSSGARFRLLFHDTHQGAVATRESAQTSLLSGYDGVLANGDQLREAYLDRGRVERAWTWHEAADTRVFRPPVDRSGVERVRDIVFIGNWGDSGRSRELREYLMDPTEELGISATCHGVGYPEQIQSELTSSGVRYEGWLPNFRVPLALARHRVALHLPRRPMTAPPCEAPSIRVFEALACGVPLIPAPWDDGDGLLCSGVDYLLVRSSAAMKRQLALLICDRAFARELAERGRRTILARHTCAHRVDELMSVLAEIGMVDFAASRVEPIELHAS